MNIRYYVNILTEHEYLMRKPISLVFEVKNVKENNKETIDSQIPTPLVMLLRSDMYTIRYASQTLDHSLLSLLSQTMKEVASENHTVPPVHAGVFGFLHPVRHLKYCFYAAVFVHQIYLYSDSVLSFVKTFSQTNASIFTHRFCYMAFIDIFVVEIGCPYKKNGIVIWGLLRYLCIISCLFSAWKNAEHFSR